MERTELILPLSKPKIGVQGVTGSWRIRRPVINYGKCIGCGICWLYCPDNTIEIENTGSKFRVSVDYTYCKGCGICSSVCPVKAIDMVKEV